MREAQGLKKGRSPQALPAVRCYSTAEGATLGFYYRWPCCGHSSVMKGARSARVGRPASIDARRQGLNGFPGCLHRAWARDRQCIRFKILLRCGSRRSKLNVVLRSIERKRTNSRAPRHRPTTALAYGCSAAPCDPSVPSAAPGPKVVRVRRPLRYDG